MDSMDTMEKRQLKLKLKTIWTKGPGGGGTSAWLGK